MSVITAILLGLAMGAAFGFFLEKARVFEPAVIIGQFQLRSFLMLRVFLAGVAGLIVLAVLQGLGVVKLAPKALLPMADIIGGLFLGAGIALAGACPGTVLAQIGAGYRDAWATLVGRLLGAPGFHLFGTSAGGLAAHCGARAPHARYGDRAAFLGLGTRLRGASDPGAGWAGKMALLAGGTWPRGRWADATG